MVYYEIYWKWVGDKYKYKKTWIPRMEMDWFERFNKNSSKF